MQFPNIDPGWAVGATGLFIGVVQLWLGHRRQRFDRTMLMLDKLQAPNAMEARFSVQPLVEKAGPEHDYEKLEETERARLTGIIQLFGTIGLLLRRGRIEPEILLAGYAGSIRRNRARLMAYRTWHRDEQNGAEGAYWRDYDWLAERARRYLKYHNLPDPDADGDV